MSLNLNAALSSFIAVSPRIIHHSKTQHWKKKKKKTSTDLSRDQNTICVWTQYSNRPSCSNSASRFVYGPKNTWMGHTCFYLFLFFLLCATSSPPFVTSAAPSSVLRWRRLWLLQSGCHWKWVCEFVYMNAVVTAANSHINNYSKNIISLQPVGPLSCVGPWASAPWSPYINVPLVLSVTMWELLKYIYCLSLYISSDGNNGVINKRRY